MSSIKLPNYMKRLRRKHPLSYVLFVVAFLALAYWQGWFQPVDTKSLMHLQPGSYQVSNFVDGDTIRVMMNGTEETIRFIGIDTPETHKPDTPVQCYGPAASAYTQNRIGSQAVRLMSAGKTTDRDRYGRLLR